MKTAKTRWTVGVSLSIIDFMREEFTMNPPNDVGESSDRPLLDLIRRRGPLSVAEMVEAMGVTPTAIRNRLGRLIGSGLVERRVEHGGRGRPRHTYLASAEAHKKLGQNYADLALVLWDEMMRHG